MPIQRAHLNYTAYCISNIFVRNFHKNANNRKRVNDNVVQIVECRITQVHCYSKLSVVGPKISTPLISQPTTRHDLSSQCISLYSLRMLSFHLVHATTPFTPSQFCMSSLRAPSKNTMTLNHRLLDTTTLTVHTNLKV